MWYELTTHINIKVLLQLGIDSKTGDSDNIYVRALTTATPYERTFKQVTFLKNRAYVDFFKQNKIIGNNKPIDENAKYIFDDEDDKDEDDIVDDTDKKKDDETDTKFEGALVADPELNSHGGIEIFGMKSKYLWAYVVDQDFSQMYPNVIISFNICANSLIGKLCIRNMKYTDIKHFYELNAKDVRRFDAGKEFVEQYLCGNFALMGKTFFNLPDSSELISDFAKEYNM